MHKMDCMQVNFIQLYTFELELHFAEYRSTLMCGLRILARPDIYHLLGNVISATVGLVYINLQPE